MFGFGKKKEEQKPTACCCGGSKEAVVEAPACCCGEAVDGICCVKVLGAGCKSCHEQYENAKAAVKAMGLPVEVEYITDMEQVMTYGAMSMPAIVVNEKVVSMGRVLKAAEVEKLLRKLGEPVGKIGLFSGTIQSKKNPLPCIFARQGSDCQKKVNHHEEPCHYS